MATANKGLNQPVIGSSGWGPSLNDNAGYIDDALGGVTSISVTGVTATPVPLTIAQYRNLIINFSGVLTDNVTYQVPSGVGGQWTVQNSATGAFTITIASLGGGTSSVVSSSSVFIVSDGTNISALAPLPNGVTATAADLNILSGQSAAGLTGTELGYVNGVTSAIQTQLDEKVDVAGETLGGIFLSTYTSVGTVSSGTFTPSVSSGSRNWQYLLNGGAFTFAAPTIGSTEAVNLVVYVQNTSGAGAITFSGFGKVTGDPLTTTVSHIFYVYVTRLGTGAAIANVVAAQ